MRASHHLHNFVKALNDSRPSKQKDGKFTNSMQDSLVNEHRNLLLKECRAGACEYSIK